MHNRSPLRALAPVLLVAISGCTTQKDAHVEKRHGGGTSRVYAVDAAHAYDAAREVFREEGADPIEDHRESNYLLTSSGPGFATQGSVMGAWFQPVDEYHTLVTVVTKRRVSVTLATTLTESTFHDRFATKVGTEGLEPSERRQASAPRWSR
jgi:hypothetical protein